MAQFPLVENRKDGDVDKSGHESVHNDRPRSEPAGGAALGVSEEDIARAIHAELYGQWYEGPLRETDSQAKSRRMARAVLSLINSRATPHQSKSGDGQ